MKLPILILHGWGKTGDAYSAAAKLFEENGYRVYAPTMPGFGHEKLLGSVMTVDDYADWVSNYIKRNKLKKIILIGHSFGGRVAAKLCVLHPELVDTLVLTGAPLIRERLSLKKKVAAEIANKGKIFISFFPSQVQAFLRKLLYRSIGEYDYLRSGRMKDTFQAVINENLESVLEKIPQKTLLLWGEKDISVPLKIGRAIEKRMQKAKLVTIKKASHKLPYENPTVFAQEVLQFL